MVSQDNTKSDTVEKTDGLEATANRFGDLICPYCNVRMITPPWAFVRAGTGRCPLCKNRYVVSKNTAEEANRNIEESFLANPLETRVLLEKSETPNGLP